MKCKHKYQLQMSGITHHTYYQCIHCGRDKIKKEAL